MIKNKKVVKKEMEAEEVMPVTPKEPVALLTIDFAREDLNMLRDKVNELANRENGK